MPLLEIPFLPLQSGLTPLHPSLPMSSLPLAEISGAQMLSIVAVAAQAVVASFLVVYGIKYFQRRQELWHETARLALEKGQPLPEPPRQKPPEKRSDQGNDFRAGLILIATGGGLYYFFISLFGGWMRFVGAIPGFIGVALVLYASLNALFSRKDKPADDDLPPRS